MADEANTAGSRIDVFISYARKDRGLVEAVKPRLEELGLSVFFDIEGLDGGDTFPDVLDRAVKSAGCVLGCWTPHALSRDWVKTECAIALERQTLVASEFEAITSMDVPAAFYRLHRVNLKNWRGERDHEGWLSAVRSISKRLNRAELIDRARSAAAASSSYDAEVLKPAHELDLLWEEWSKLAVSVDRSAIKDFGVRVRGTIIGLLVDSRLEDLARPAAARMLTGSQAVGRVPLRGWRLFRFVVLRVGLIGAGLAGVGYLTNELVHTQGQLRDTRDALAEAREQVGQLRSDSTEVAELADTLTDNSERQQAERAAGQLARSAELIEIKIAGPGDGTEFRASAMLNLRTSPTMAAPVLTVVSEGAILTFVGATDDPDWWLVEHRSNGETVRGFVNNNYLRADSDEGAEPSPPAELIGARFSYDQLVEFGGPEIRNRITAEEWSRMLRVMNEYGVTNSNRRFSHFMAQISHESRNFGQLEEGLNYSGDALWTVFRKYFESPEEARSFARQPERIANRVYASRMGNGDAASGDGWRYRGRGYLWLTGRENYNIIGSRLGVDLVKQPDQLATDRVLAMRSALEFWRARNLNDYADRDDINSITRRINGGTNGLANRRALLLRAQEIWPS